jgi:hypothetical protein
MRVVLAVLIALAALAAPARAQEQRPTHFVVLNKPGPHFARLADFRQEALSHRDIYLRLTAEGQIIASGTLSGEPVLGITVFRQGVDEAAIRRLLMDDAIVRAGILEVEFRHWSIQMGGLHPPPPEREAE